MSLSETAQQREQAARTLDERRESGFERFAADIQYEPKPHECEQASRTGRFPVGFVDNDWDGLN